MDPYRSVPPPPPPHLPPILPRNVRDQDQSYDSMSEYNSPSTAVSPSRDVGEGSSRKRQVSETTPARGGGSGETSASGSKRQRVHFSCTECHRRKQKCNRQTPCQHCIARKVPERCHTFQPGQDETLDLNARVNKLERTVEDGFDRIMSLLQTRTVPSQQDTRLIADPSATVPPAVAAAQTAPPKTPGPRRPSPRTAQSGMTALDGDEPNQGAALNASGSFHGSGASMVMKIDTLLSDVGQMNTVGPVALPMRFPEPGDQLDAKMWEYGAAERMSATLIASLPSRQVCQLLVAHFFDDINFIRHPLPERLMRPLFDEYLGTEESFPTPISFDNINVFACLALVLSIASLTLEHERFPKDAGQRRMTGRRFEWAGRRALHMSQILGKDDLFQTMGHTLCWRFLMIDRRITEAWRSAAAAVQSSYAIGLHRDGSKLGLSQRDTDLRRAVWHAVRYADLILSMNLGRPPTTDYTEAFSDAQHPTEQGYAYWWQGQAPSSREPVPVMYHHAMHRLRLTKLCGKISALYQKVEPRHYSDVLALDAEILEVREALPQLYRVNISSKGELEYDSSRDEEYPGLFVHRYLIYMELFFIRISLHRSYLLRSGAKGSGQRFIPSRRACVESAMEDLALRGDFVKALHERFTQGKVPLVYYIQIGSYSWFNSLLVASIAAILDPTIPELPQIRDHLDRFFKANELKKTHARAAEMKDDMRERENKILEMLSAAIEKSSSAAASRASSSATNKLSGKAAKNRSTAEQRASGEATTSSTAANNAAASREEATADVLLDLGKGSQASGAIEGAKTGRSRNSSASKPATNAGQRLVESPSSGSPIQSAGSASRTPGGPGQYESASPAHAASANTTGHRHSASHPHSSGFSTNSSDSPNTRVVDDAQADLNNWFHQEFAGGTLVDRGMTDLGLPDGSRPRGDQHGDFVNGFEGGGMATDMPGGSNFGNSLAGAWNMPLMNNNPGGNPGNARPANAYGSTAYSTGLASGAGPSASSSSWPSISQPSWDSHLMGAGRTASNPNGSTDQNAFMPAASSIPDGSSSTSSFMGPSQHPNYNQTAATLMAGAGGAVGGSNSAFGPGGGANGPVASGSGGGVNNNFDPNFWSELINKILT